MLWYFSWPTPTVILVDVLYLTGVVLFCAALSAARSGRSSFGGFVCSGWILVVVAFLMRHVLLLYALWPEGEEPIVRIALTRCVLHTLVVPCLLSMFSLALSVLPPSRLLKKPKVMVVTLLALAAVTILVGGWAFVLILLGSSYPYEVPFP